MSDRGWWFTFVLREKCFFLFFFVFVVPLMFEKKKKLATIVHHKKATTEYVQHLQLIDEIKAIYHVKYKRVYVS